MVPVSQFLFFRSLNDFMTSFSVIGLKEKVDGTKGTKFSKELRLLSDSIISCLPTLIKKLLSSFAISFASFFCSAVYLEFKNILSIGNFLIY